MDHLRRCDDCDRVALVKDEGLKELVVGMWKRLTASNLEDGIATSV